MVTAGPYQNHTAGSSFPFSTLHLRPPTLCSLFQKLRDNWLWTKLH